jgi:hypothetical protein
MEIFYIGVYNTQFKKHQQFFTKTLATWLGQHQLSPVNLVYQYFNWVFYTRFWKIICFSYYKWNISLNHIVDYVYKSTRPIC